MNQIISVSQLTLAIKKKLELSFSFICVRGEISNLRKQASGHTYFTLKDTEAQISAVLFRNHAMHLSQPLKEGDQVILRGELSVYPPRGNYQIIVHEIEFSGVGELLKRLHTLKQKLEKLGWLDPSIKKPFPLLPQKIGIVTSPTGSVIQDMIHVLTRRFPGVRILLNPVRVQGEEAASEIAKAIRDFNTFQLADILIIGRGGGSFEDLWPFNEEVVAQAIHESNIPVISAIGHETDFTIADFVADLRAPTPSAAAEMVTAGVHQMRIQIEKAKTQMAQSLQGHLVSHRRRIETILKNPLLKSPHILLSSFIQKIDAINEDLYLAIRQILSQNRLRLSALIKQKELLDPQAQISEQKKQFSKKNLSLHWAMQNILREKRQSLEQLMQHLHSIDPRNLLKKGYSILFHEKKDSVILSTKDVELGDQLQIHLSYGKLLAEVKKKYE